MLNIIPVRTQNALQSTLLGSFSHSHTKHNFAFAVLTPHTVTTWTDFINLWQILTVPDFRVITAVRKNIALFWDVTQCLLIQIYGRLGGMHYLHVQSIILPRRKGIRFHRNVGTFQCTWCHISEDFDYVLIFLKKSGEKYTNLSN